MEKFHYFLYGNKSTFKTYQKPLVSIHWKTPSDVSPRIQRLIMRALPCNFHVVYVPGKLILMADPLSRNLKFTAKDEEVDQISLQILAINYITGNYQQHPDKPVMNWIREETLKMPHYNCWQSTSEMVGLQIKWDFQRNCTLTGIIEMNFPWWMESCWSHIEF